METGLFVFLHYEESITNSDNPKSHLLPLGGNIWQFLVEDSDFLPTKRDFNPESKSIIISRHNCIDQYFSECDLQALFRYSVEMFKGMVIVLNLSYINALIYCTEKQQKFNMRHHGV